MKKNKNVIIASVVAVALVGVVAISFGTRNKATDIQANNKIENNTEEQENINEITTLILNGDEKFKIEDYTGALKDYENALNKIENDEDLKIEVSKKIENTKTIIEKTEKETEVTTFENTNQEDVDNATNEQDVAGGNSSNINSSNNSSVTEKQTEVTTQATTNKAEPTTQATTKKPVETTTVKKEPVTETTTAKSSNNTSSKQPTNSIPKEESLDELLKQNGWTDDDIANSGGGTGEIADFSSFSTDGTMGKYLGE